MCVCVSVCERRFIGVCLFKLPGDKAHKKAMWERSRQQQLLGDMCLCALTMQLFSLDPPGHASI